YSTIFKPRIGAFSSSFNNSETECQIISCFAKFKTFESTVSTESAFAATIAGACLNAASKERYLILIKVRCCGMGNKLSFASQTKASEPSEPVKMRLKLNLDKSSLKTCFKS